MHLPTVDPHVPVAVSQVAEQHWVPLWQAAPVAPHTGPTLASPLPPAVNGSTVDPPQLATNSATAHNHDERTTMPDLLAREHRSTTGLSGSTARRRPRLASLP